MLIKHVVLGKIPFSVQRYDFLLIFANILEEKCQKSVFLHKSPIYGRYRQKEMNTTQLQVG